MKTKSKKVPVSKRVTKSKKAAPAKKLQRVHIISVTAVLLIGVSAYVLLNRSSNVQLTDTAKVVTKKATPTYYYYGADLSKMTTATGVDPSNPNSIPSNKPWPQNAGNYCFIASTQAIVNYDDAVHSATLRYPTASGQGPATGNPSDEVPGQILYDLDNSLVPTGGPLKIQGSGTNRRPFTLANIAYDFGGDPRAIAAGVDYEISQSGYSSDAQYHQHIYHTTAAVATMDIAKALATYNKPVITIVNHAEHAVVVAGVWATANPATNPNAQISSLAVFNPWNQSWGTYMSTGYYAKVSYASWTSGSGLPSPYGGTNTWYTLPYASNGNIDPDPAMGIYQAGSGTANPNAHHWINNFVTIQYDGHTTSADTAYNENNVAMTKP